MARIPQPFIDELLNRLDIVEIVDARVKLKKTGKNYAACCPFHDEKTPSFTVSPDKQFYYCFGCGAAGNAIGFLMEYDRQGFVDAVEYLAKSAGLEVPKEEVSQQAIEQFGRHKQLYQLLENARDFFEKQLKSHRSNANAIRYLKERGLTGSVAKHYHLGFAPPGWDNIILHLGQNEEAIEHLTASGLVIKHEDNGRTYDRFRDRVMFPIHDVRGRVIGFGGRVLGDAKPKYLNSPETEVFHKGKELYGLYEAKQFHRELQSLLVVEGYMDVIALGQYGIRNAVATLGTACTEEHLQLAFKYTSKVVFCFDGDTAGRNAAKRALLNSLTTMQDGKEINFLFLPDGQDPDTLVRQIGMERFLHQIETAMPLGDFLFEVAAENCNINSMEGRAKFSKTAAPLLAKIPKSIYSELMFANLAKRTGLSTEALRELTQEDINLNFIEPAQPESVTLDSENPAPQHLTETSAAPTVTTKQKSRVSLNPVRIATILLLDQPQLLEEQLVLPEESEDPETARLINITAYLRKRPQSTFSSIIGYWGGAYGVEAQQELAQLVASQIFSDKRTLGAYDAKLELSATFKQICAFEDNKKQKAELNTLLSLNYTELSAEQKKRLNELVALKNTSK